MKRILVVGIGLFGLSAATFAHGLHAPVEPKYHALVHVLQLAGIGVLSGIVGWIAVRRRARR